MTEEQRMILEGLLAGSPWRASGVVVTAEDLSSLYDALPNADEWCLERGFTRSDRRFDVAISLLKRRGLVRFQRGIGWERVG